MKLPVKMSEFLYKSVKFALFLTVTADILSLKVLKFGKPGSTISLMWCAGGGVAGFSILPVCRLMTH